MHGINPSGLQRQAGVAHDADSRLVQVTAGFLLLSWREYLVQLLVELTREQRSAFYRHTLGKQDSVARAGTARGHQPVMGNFTDQCGDKDWPVEVVGYFGVPAKDGKAHLAAGGENLVLRFAPLTQVSFCFQGEEAMTNTSAEWRQWWQYRCSLPECCTNRFHPLRR